VVGDPVTRREPAAPTPSWFAQKPHADADRFRTASHRRGRPMTDLPVTPSAGTCELRLGLGNLGPGDYLIELSAQAGD
jgi:hypothetical protein